MLILYLSTLMKNSKYLHFRKIIFLLVFNFLWGQQNAYEIKLNIYPKNNNFWWLNNNNDGRKVDKSSIDLQWQVENHKTKYQIIITNAYSDKNNIQLGESFIFKEISNDISIKIGKYYRDFSLYLNDNLSSGSMLISRNAEPMPKIGILGSFKLKKNISFNWGVSHAQFDKNEFYSDGPYLHEKFLYLKYKKNNNSIGLGFVHEAMWSGTTSMGYNQGKQPGKFTDFLKVIISADGPLREGEVHANAIGNHLGIWDFYYQKTNNNQIIKLYYQHFFEDTSSLRFANKIDGLWGIELENYLSNTNLLLEYLDTSNCCIDPPYQSDQYYYNYQYRSGWSYKNNILGNPFVNSEGYQLGDVELTKLLHLGIESKIKSNTFQLKAARRIDISDDMKFKISINKNLDQLDLKIFIVGNEQNTAAGISVAYLFNGN